MKDMERIVLEDIRSLAEDEEKAKAKFLVHKAKQHEEQYSVDTKNSQMADTVCRSLPARCAWSLSNISRLMPMLKISPVISTSTTSCSMNL